MNKDKILATEYQFQDEWDNDSRAAIKIQRTKGNYDGERWAVRRDGNFCLNSDGYWESEPSPSNRDDEFFSRCRFTSFEGAMAAAKSFRD